MEAAEPGVGDLGSDFMGFSRALSPCRGHGDSHSPPATCSTPPPALCWTIEENRHGKAHLLARVVSCCCRSLTLMDGGCGRGINTMAHMEGQGHPAQSPFSLFTVLGAPPSSKHALGDRGGYGAQGAHSRSRLHCQDCGGHAGAHPPPASALRVLWQWLSGDGPGLGGSLVLPH